MVFISNESILALGFRDAEAYVCHKIRTCGPDGCSIGMTDNGVYIGYDIDSSRGIENLGYIDNNHENLFLIT
jgi:hypothetical protein